MNSVPKHYVLDIRLDENKHMGLKYLFDPYLNPIYCQNFHWCRRLRYNQAQLAKNIPLKCLPIELCLTLNILQGDFKIALYTVRDIKKKDLANRYIEPQLH